MNIRNRSMLRFKNYIVKEVMFKTNELFKRQDKIYVDFFFDHNVNYNEMEKCMEIELICFIFRDSIENNYPFEMRVSILGLFEIDSEEFELQAFESNALAILFPYLRALISTYTANSNVIPVILPAMNINSYLKEKYSNQ